MGYGDAALCEWDLLLYLIVVNWAGCYAKLRGENARIPVRAYAPFCGSKMVNMMDCTVLIASHARSDDAGEKMGGSGSREARMSHSSRMRLRDEWGTRHRLFC